MPKSLTCLELASQLQRQDSDNASASWCRLLPENKLARAQQLGDGYRQSCSPPTQNTRRMIVKMDKTAQETHFECSDGCVKKQKDRMVSLTSDLQDELNKETVFSVVYIDITPTIWGIYRMMGGKYGAKQKVLLLSKWWISTVLSWREITGLKTNKNFQGFHLFALFCFPTNPFTLQQNTQNQSRELKKIRWVLAGSTGCEEFLQMSEAVMYSRS